MTKICIMGCGRSGTTLLLTLMTNFKDLYAHIDAASVPGEDRFRVFDQLQNKARTTVVKRVSDAYALIDEFPTDLKVLYLVRHPLDVCTSVLKYRGEVYKNYIPPDRWLAEAEALKSFLCTEGAEVMVVRYEDLVGTPNEVQQRIAHRFQLSPLAPFSRGSVLYTASADIDATLNGARPPEPGSIGRWRDDQHIDHSREVWQLIQEEGCWFCELFDYDLVEISRRLDIGFPESHSAAPVVREGAEILRL